MKPSFSFPSRLAGACGAVLLGTLASCSHGGGQSAVAQGSGTVIVFSLADMEGDWVGQLVPDNAAKPPRNFYLRVSGGQLVEAADSVKTTWTTGDSQMLMDLAQDGELHIDMDYLPGSSSMVLDGLMAFDKESLTGTYDYSGSVLLQSSGTFTLTRSSGPGHFTMPLITGDWDGYGYNKLSRTRDFELVIDVATGQVLSGRFIRPDGSTQHNYSIGAGTFAYFDDAVGRLEDVVLVADNGHVVTFQQLLVDADGTLMGGPGHDTQMGSGIIEMHRP